MQVRGLVHEARQKARGLRRRVRTVRRRLAEPEGTALARRVRAERLTFLEEDALLELWVRMRELERAGVPGSVMEAGCALGGSAIVLAAAKSAKRPMQVFDVFGVIPPPSERDDADVHKRYETILAGEAVGFGGDAYYGYQENLRDTVAASFARLGYPLEAHAVELVPGLFQDTVRPVEPVALGHIDGDWYESVKVCLERMWPVLSPGGVLVVDDYWAWSGCRTAVDEWLTGRTDVLVEQRSRPHLIKRV